MDIFKIAQLMEGSFLSACGRYVTRLHPLDNTVSGPPRPTNLLYLEQYEKANPKTPIRQRVYHIQKHSTTPVLLLYRFAPDTAPPTPATAENLALVDIKAIIPIVDAEMQLIERNGKIWGELVAGSMPSSFRGAVSMTSRICIAEEGLTTWDRGFDANSNQVWGPGEEGMFFRRLSPAELLCLTGQPPQ